MVRQRVCGMNATRFSLCETVAYNMNMNQILVSLSVISVMSMQDSTISMVGPVCDGVLETT
jgi:hypothetical protein